MKYRKRSSETIDTAHKQLAETEKRLAESEIIEPLAHLSNRLEIAAWAAQINNASKMVQEYNRMVDELEASEVALDAQVAKVEEMNEQILAATAAKYGIDSIEYEIVSGKRKPNRKLPRKKQPRSK